MYSSRKRRSVPMELPHRGTLRASGMWDLMKSSVATSASRTLTDEARIAGSSPERVCISVTNSPISASWAGLAWMTRSGPSAMTLRSSSVMMVAISTMTCRRGSSPVISRSIQASMSRH